MQDTSLSDVEKRVLVRPEDTGQALENPGMGWVLHYYDNGLEWYGSRLDPSDALEDFPGITVVYLRLGWGYIEPEEGKFRWELIDTPAQRWISRGKKIALRFSCSEWDEQPATPAWVRDAGAKGYYFTPGKGVDEQGKDWEPDYNDPIFLQKHEAFLRAVAERYDGTPEIAFIDVGSFGVWGEMHNFWSTKLDYDAETIMRHLDLYARVFKNTLVVYNTAAVDHGRGIKSLEYAQQLGMTIRDDSILVLAEELTPQRWSRAEPFWRTVPIVLESQHYGMSKRDGFWGDGSGYLLGVEQYHASYVSIHWWPREFLEENQELVAQIGRRMGYRLQLIEASWPEQIQAGTHYDFNCSWRNSGVAPCLPGGYVSITLKDEQNGIVAVWVDDSWNVSSLPVLESATAITRTIHCQLSERLQPGTYTLWLSVGSKNGTPRIALPMTQDDGQRRYALGRMTLKTKDVVEEQRE